jgi:glucokinase
MPLDLSPVVAVDIGGTKFIVAVIDSDGRALSRIYCLTMAHEGPKKVITRLISTIRAAIKRSAIRTEDIGGIGVAVASIIDSGRGLITEAPNLPRWKNIRLRHILSQELEVPVYLINDASAAALGENRLGAGRGFTNMIYLTISTGIGGGIIINGELYEGTDGCAGELGHMIIDAHGPECGCGRQGCLEVLASGTAIARMAKERLKAGEESLVREMADGIIDDVKAEKVAAAARKGDAMALEVIHTAASYLGIGLGNMVNIFNPQLIIIGGGVSKMGEMFLKPVRKSMKEHAFKLPARTVRVVRSGLGADSELLGAAVYTLQKRSGGK